MKKKFEYLDFYGNILKVKSTIDPPMILWENLSASYGVRFAWYFFTYSCSFVIIFISLLAVYSIDEYGKSQDQKWLPSILIAIIVSGTKIIMRKITILEKHNNLASQRRSMVRKMVALQFCTIGLLILLNSFADRSTF